MRCLSLVLHFSKRQNMPDEIVSLMLGAGAWKERISKIVEQMSAACRLRSGDKDIDRRHRERALAALRDSWSTLVCRIISRP